MLFSAPWGYPAFIEVLPRREVKYSDPEGDITYILMDEEIDQEVTLSLLNYKGIVTLFTNNIIPVELFIL